MLIFSMNIHQHSYETNIFVLRTREERSGTPTVDEPTNGVGYTPSYGSTGQTLPPGSVPGAGTVPSLIGAVPPIQVITVQISFPCYIHFFNKYSFFLHFYLAYCMSSSIKLLAKSQFISVTRCN